MTVEMMSRERHFAALRRLYRQALINNVFRPNVQIAERLSIIEIDLHDGLHHTGHAVHSAVLYKLLEDAACLAAGSIEPEFHVRAARFSMEMVRLVAEGRIHAVGRVAEGEGTNLVAEAVLFDAEGCEIGRGCGLVVRTRIPLRELEGYYGIDGAKTCRRTGPCVR